MSGQRQPRHAATIILLRHAQPSGFDVLLIRRPDEMAFLGGMHCFPGGGLTKEDCSAGMLRRCYGLTAGQARNILGAHFAPHQALGLWAAGIRELFEKVGILLAVSKTEERLVGTAIGKSNFVEKRAALLEKTLSFASFLEAERLLWDASSLAYFSNWQTPAQISECFDTRFFLALLPAGQAPLSTSPEVAHSLWLTPDRALELFGKDQLPMIFPTFASLRTLADFESLESVSREYGLNTLKDHVHRPRL
jgi:8-oxo-dGTP pyrophosphatase MutT (NUDIX family)